MLRRSAGLAAILFISWPAAAFADPLIEIRSGQSVVVPPGGFFSATLAVPQELDGSVALLRDRVILPPGWNALSPIDLPFAPAGGDRIRMIAVPVPLTAAAGDYRIIYTLSPDNDPGRELARAELRLTVPAVSSLRIELENVPEQLIAGDSLRATWRLTNRSNHSTSIQAHARSSLGLPVTLSSSALVLAPGESARISADAASPAGLRSEQTHELLLETRFGTGSGQSLQIVSAPTRLIPRVTFAPESPDDLRLFLKTTAARRKAGNQEDTGFQTELYGGGFLDAERTRRLDLLLRSSQFGDARRILGQERYTARYRSPALDLLLGETTFSLSPLTQRWQWGRGAGVEYRHAPLAAGVYFLETRFTPEESQWQGWFLQYDAARSLRLRSNLLVQERALPGPSTETHSVLPSLQVFLRPNRMNSLELEASASDNQHRSDGQAWRARLKGRGGENVYYDFEHINASPDYFGYYHDLVSTNGNVSWQPTPEWLAQGSFLETRNNPDRNPRKSSAFENRTASAGLDRRLSPILSTSLNYYYTESGDALRPTLPGFQQNSLNLAVTASTRPVMLRASAEGGRTRIDRPGASSAPFQYFSLMALTRSSKTSTVSLYLGDGDSRYDPRRRETMASGAVQWDFQNGFHFRTAASLTRYRDGQDRDQGSAEVGAAYRFRHGSFIESNIRISSLDNRQQERALFVSYTVPLPVPAIHTRGSASLAGEIKIETSAGLQPVAGVILHLGKLLAATDHRGRFVFPSVKAGRHELTVDQASLGLNTVLIHPGPFIIELTRGQRTQFDLFAARAARMEGEIARYENSSRDLSPLSDASPPASYQRVAPLAKIRVELRRDGEKTRNTFTDGRGRFAFDRLPPGEWTLAVDETALPERHKLESREYSFALTPGASTRVELRVLPVHRPMQMLENRRLSVTHLSSP
ncbi:MAG: carboxypeptidase-like regulatory domain-containing protein [Nibricoccus sp.]